MLECLVVVGAGEAGREGGGQSVLPGPNSAVVAAAFRQRPAVVRRTAAGRCGLLHCSYPVTARSPGPQQAAPARLTRQPGSWAYLGLDCTSRDHSHAITKLV